MIVNRPSVVLILVSFLTQAAGVSAWAAQNAVPEEKLLSETLSPSTSHIDRTPISKSGATEYVFQPFPGAVLMPVNLWGSVQRAGVYRVPLNTDLVTLMSIAGGPTESANLENITIRRQVADRAGVMTVDGEAMLKKKNVRPPVLEANDIVYIPKTQPLVSSDTMLALTVIASLLSIVVSGLVINSQLKR